MKLVIRTLIFHLLSMITFAYLYLYLSDEFVVDNKKEAVTFLDYLMLSVTIQAGVGMTNIYPASYYTKYAVIIQQLLMMMTHIITLYIFTL